MYRKPFKHRPMSISPLRHRETDPVVQNDLAITPQQALTMAETGIAIGSNSWQQLTTEQRKDKDMFVPLERQRHVDMADMFQAQQDTYQKIQTYKKGVKEGSIKPLETSMED